MMENYCRINMHVGKNSHNALDLILEWGPMLERIKVQKPMKIYEENERKFSYHF